MVTLVEAPRGLDLPVASAALIDADDVRLGLAVGAGSADVFFLLGVGDDDALAWLDQQATRRAPAAIFVKEPSDAVVARAVAAGTAVVAVEPRARWERLYRLVDHVFEHHGDRADPLYDSSTDLFGLAQSIADRTHGMVSIEDVAVATCWRTRRPTTRPTSCAGCRSSAARDRPSTWRGSAGRASSTPCAPRGDVVRVDARPELGLRPRRAVGIHHVAAGPQARPGLRGHHLAAGGRPAAGRRRRRRAARARRCWPRGSCRGWRPRRPRTPCGCRSCSACATAPSTTSQLADVARELGIVADGRVAVIGFDGAAGAPARLADVLALSASAFRPDAQVAAGGVAGLRAVPAHRQGVVGDVVDPRHHRRPARRAGPRAAGRDRHSRQRVWRAWRPRGRRWTACSTAPNATPAPSVR